MTIILSCQCTRSKNKPSDSSDTKTQHWYTIKLVFEARINPATQIKALQYSSTTNTENQQYSKIKSSLATHDMVYSRYQVLPPEKKISSHFALNPASSRYHFYDSDFSFACFL